ncbi:TPA: hypothetical protein N0F65_001550 [Lagenidium giganteum]|uniref:Uncharacterized protein n=1 Tax=Lagenidium giganteum TaxID=4803 RepID=A0AAV2YDG2_9STRA|nr:TPA: hypothetical protein N0F65_001550 [Lagenidium giganteum]
MRVCAPVTSHPALPSLPSFHWKRWRHRSPGWLFGRWQC